MTVLVLAAKAAVAVLLLAAGGAKLADRAGFAAAVRLFVPRAWSARVHGLVPAAAAAVIAAELIAGAVSLCWPSAAWADLGVLALACGFVAVAFVGYARYRGRPCRCFGALTRRSFSLPAVAQSLAILAAAALPVFWRAGEAFMALGLAGHVLLLAAAGVLALAAGTAAKALASTEVAA
jgi:hypothetical protein